MHVDVIIVGQGVCGTMLSWFLHREGKSFLVIDAGVDKSATLASAGIINPVTGRRYHTAWMAETLLPFAEQTYTAIGEFIGQDILVKGSVVDFFPHADARQAFETRKGDHHPFLSTEATCKEYDPFFHFYSGCGSIVPAYVVSMPLLLTAWRQWLLDKECLLEETLDEERLQTTGKGVQYGEVKASKIIYCNGLGAMVNSLFSRLPFSASKGEALLVEAKLPPGRVYKKSMLLAPTHQQDIFWLGSNYLWQFDDASPTENFRATATRHLTEWLKQPFKIVDHLAGIRPSTLERRPFVGLHPLNKAVGILNGMGTKGASLAPYFAHQLVQHILYNFPVEPAADISRFSGILKKQAP